MMFKDRLPARGERLFLSMRFYETAALAIGIGASVALTTSNTAQLSYVVPAGHWVRLVSTISGTGTTAIVSQVEETLN